MTKPLEDLLCRVAGTDQKAEGAADDVRGDQGATWRLRDRLPEERIQALLVEYQAGATAREVAERYGFGTTG